MKNIYIGDTISQSSIKCFDKHHYCQYPFLYNMQMGSVECSLKLFKCSSFCLCTISSKVLHI